MITFLAIAMMIHQRNHKKFRIDFKELDMVMKQLKEKPSLNKMSEILDEGVNLIAIYILSYNRDSVRPLID